MSLSFLFLLSALVACSYAAIGGYCVPYVDKGCAVPGNGTGGGSCNCLPETFETCDTSGTTPDSGVCKFTAATWAIVSAGAILSLVILITIVVLIGIFCCGTCMCCACSACCKKKDKNYAPLPQDGWESDNNRY